MDLNQITKDFDSWRNLNKLPEKDDLEHNSTEE